MRVLAVDQGTTSTRALVFEPGEPPRLTFQRRHRQVYPRPGWVEHDPLELLADVEAAFASAGPVDAAGLANQGESCLAWDRVSGEPLSPVIVWQDARTARQVEALRAEGLGPEVAARAGVPLDSYFSASKLAWLLRETPAAQAALRAGRLRLGTTDSFLLRRLTGVDATDATTASRTSLMDLRRLQWDPWLCERFGVPMEALAPIRPTMGHFGEHKGTLVRASVVDQQASLYGHGCRMPGDLKMTFGTGAFALALIDGPPPAAPPNGLAATVAWSSEGQTAYALEGGVLDAGAAIEWAKRVGLLTDDAELDGLEEEPWSDEVPMFVPALSGLPGRPGSRRPAGAWLGLSIATSRADLHRALLQGIALQSASLLRRLAAYTRLEVVRVDGGVSANRYFLRALADATGAVIVRNADQELTSFGCASMAANCEHPGGARATQVCPKLDIEIRTRWTERHERAVTAALNGAI